LAASVTVRFTVSGTPSAFVVEEPNDVVMSERTMPESSRALGPLDPSPG
jgi:hypothetical protein